MKIDRLVSIIMVLLDKNRIGAQELADMFEVSLRTIYRDIDAINMAGIPVRGTSGVNGGFEIMPEYKLDKKVFSAADLSAILMGLSSLSNMIHGDERPGEGQKLYPCRQSQRHCVESKSDIYRFKPMDGQQEHAAVSGENQSCPAGKPAAFF